MKRILILTAALITLIASQSFAQISPTDRLAVNSGVSLWMSAWKSAGNVAQAKLEPLYGKNVVTYSATAADQVKRSWAEFANVIRERSADLAAVIAAQKGEPQVTVDRDRLVTSFSSGIRLVWEKTNGVWRIVEQNLPATQGSMTALAE
jgi:hypothetical protein